jgi:hypothetical protein
MNPKDTIKEYLSQGQVMKIRQWAKDNEIYDIDRLIDAAAHELLKEQQAG